MSKKKSKKTNERLDGFKKKVPSFQEFLENPGVAEQEEPEGGEATPEPGTPEYMLTDQGLDWQEVVKPDNEEEGWQEPEAVGLAQEFVDTFGEPDYVEESQLTWNEVTDPQGTYWDQLILRDMADDHKDHTDSIFGVKHVDAPQDKKAAIHQVEGVVSTAGTYVFLICGSTLGLNTILEWVYKQAEMEMPDGEGGDVEEEKTTSLDLERVITRTIDDFKIGESPEPVQIPGVTAHQHLIDRIVEAIGIAVSPDYQHQGLAQELIDNKSEIKTILGSIIKDTEEVFELESEELAKTIMRELEEQGILSILKEIGDVEEAVDAEGNQIKGRDEYYLVKDKDSKLYDKEVTVEKIEGPARVMIKDMEGNYDIVNGEHLQPIQEPAMA